MTTQPDQASPGYNLSDKIVFATFGVLAVAFLVGLAFASPLGGQIVTLWDIAADFLASVATGLCDAFVDVGRWILGSLGLA